MTLRRRHLAVRSIWQQLTETYGVNCVYCHTNTAVHIDHVIPYSYCKYNGIENLRPSCALCNLLASDSVFETFDEKYDYIREQRARRKNKKTLLTCSICLLPYYSALCPNGLLCPICSDREYDTHYTRQRGFAEWLGTLRKADFVPSAHTELRDIMFLNLGTSIPIRDKIELLVSFYPLSDDVTALLAA